MGNPWVEFVRQYAKDNNISYGCAISEAGVAYRAMKKGGNPKKEKEERGLMMREDFDAPKAQTKKRITIKKKETNQQQIRDAEYELKDILDNTEQIHFFTGIRPKLTGKSRMLPAHKKAIQDYKREYNYFKNKLEAMTNNKYPEFPEWDNVKKEFKKREKIDKKEEAEKDRLRKEEERERIEYNLRHGIEEEKPYEFPKKKKKKSGILF